MRRRDLAASAVRLLLATAPVIAWAPSGAAPAPPADPARPAPGAAAPPSGLDPALPLPASPPDPRVVAEARGAMRDEACEFECGPYLLITDLEDPELVAGCDALARDLDRAFAAGFGVEPVGPARGAVFLFARRVDFHRFVRRRGVVPLGYAGHAEVARGYAALPADEERGRTLATIVHELTHLVERRALGPALPRWLSEGLADSLGDAASPRGFAPPALPASELARLRLAYEQGLAGGLERLAGLPSEAFDARVRSFDYEQSALLVRFLLAEPDLAPGFRAFLGDLAAGARYDPEAVRSRLDLDWTELDRRFAAWVAAASVGASVGTR